MIAQYAIREYMAPDAVGEISTDELEALNRNRNLIGTLYQHGAEFYSQRNGGQPVERPYATFGWKETGTRWALNSPAEARAALALRYIETGDFATGLALVNRIGAAAEAANAPSDYSSASESRTASSAPASTGGSLASDEQLAALREKLSGR